MATSDLTQNTLATITLPLAIIHDNISPLNYLKQRQCFMLGYMRIGNVTPQSMASELCGGKR